MVLPAASVVPPGSKVINSKVCLSVTFSQLNCYTDFNEISHEGSMILDYSLQLVFRNKRSWNLVLRGVSYSDSLSFKKLTEQKIRK